MKFMALVLFLAACSSPLGALMGGPKVVADLQVGKENTQQIVANQTSNDAGRDIVSQKSPIIAGEIKQVTIQQTPFWMIALLVIGWLLPSPNEIARWIRGLFKR